MRNRLFVIVVVLLAAWIAETEPARSHPHVWIDARMSLDITPEGDATSVTVTWWLDTLYSQTVIAGMDENGDGRYSSSELQPLVEEAVRNLEEWSYFTDVRVGSSKIATEVPDTYSAYMDGDRLVYEFTLPLTGDKRAARDGLSVRLFDPTYYISIALHKTNPVTLTQNSGACTFHIDSAPGFNETLLIGESTFLQEGEENMEGLGGYFAETVVVSCE